MTERDAVGGNLMENSFCESFSLAVLVLIVAEHQHGISVVCLVISGSYRERYFLQKK